MTLLFEHTSEGAADEATVTAGTSGFGTPWAAVVPTGTATIKYDNVFAAHGTRSIRITRVATTDSGYCRATLGAPVARMQVRAYITMDSTPTDQVNLFAIRSASGFMGYVGVNSSGKLQLYNSTNTGVSGSAHATKTLAANTTYRVEYTIQAGATGTNDGTVTFAYYIGDSITAEHSFSSSAVSTGTVDPEQVRFGPQSTGAGVPLNIWFDDPAVGDGGAGFLGPSGVTPPTANVVLKNNCLVDSRGSTAPSGTLSYAIAPTTNTEEITPGAWLVTQTSSPQNFTVTVTSSAGGSDSEPVTVPALATGGASVQRLRNTAPGVFS